MGKSYLSADRIRIFRTIRRSRSVHMNCRSLYLTATLALACAPVFSQTPATSKPAAAKNYTPPKTPWGDPDLQGQWPAYANIPMQRPASFGTRAYLTDEEFAQRAKQAQKQTEDDNEEF